MTITAQRTSGGLAKNDNGTLRVGNRIPSSLIPGSPIEGDVWYDTLNNVLYAHNGTQWDPIGGLGLPIVTRATQTGAGSTSSTSFVDVPGPIDTSFTKRATHTKIAIVGSLSNFMSSAVAATVVSLQISSVDNEVGFFFFNDANSHRSHGLAGQIGAGLVPGVYNIRLRWRITGGTANVDSNDRFFCQFQETV